MPDDNLPVPVSTPTGAHAIAYRTIDPRRGFPERVVQVPVSRDAIAALVDDGFLVLPGFVAGERLAAMRAGLDEILSLEAGPGWREAAPPSGYFLRHLMDRQRCFFDLLRDPVLLGVARAALGPAVQVRHCSARVCVGGAPEQEFGWHIHQAVVPDPLPPFFCHPHALDILVYLDDVDAGLGPLCLVPGSHRWLHRTLDPGAQPPDQLVLEPRAGTAIVIHSNLWHRALPTHAPGALRRLVILAHTPCWMKLGPNGGPPPADGLLREARQSTDAELRELLGLGGYT